MAADETLRPQYHERQYLGAADFEAEQAYHRDMRRRHNLGHHTRGIVVGLELVEVPAEGDPAAVDVYLQPGMAVDGFGREILVLQAVPLDPALFVAFANDAHRQVWVGYDQRDAAAERAGLAACNGSAQFTRIQETYRIEVDPKPPTQDAVTVGGKPAGPPPAANPGDLTTPGDGSAPYQEFPDDADGPTWLIPLGNVHWDGVNQRFLPAVPHDRLLLGRKHVGVVAEDVLGPAGTLTLAPRVVQTDPNVPLPAYDPDAADFAEVNGRLTVDGRVVARRDVLAYGGKLHFRDAGGGDGNVPLWLQRVTGPGGTGTDLRVHIGDQAAANTRLSIGPGPADGSAEKAVLAVNGDDTVDVATGTLSFGQKTRQMINLWTAGDGTPQYGIGVQSNTTYFRSHNNFCWFKDGKHAEAAGDPGGGSLLLTLDGAANLNFGTTVRQMLNLWGTQYGVGVQDSTLYFRTGGDVCWFRGGTHSDNRGSPGGGGVLSMKLDDAASLSVAGGIGAGGGLTVAGNASVGGKFTTFSDLDVGGSLRLFGAQNVFDVAVRTFRLTNAMGNPPGTWTFDYPGRFVRVYGAFVVLHGFSLFNNSGDPNFRSFGHVADVGAIPQHVFARLDGQPGTDSAHGSFYCAESDPGQEQDNTVMFTVVVMGKPQNLV